MAFCRGRFILAVIDPGVGTDRRILVAEINQQTIVCPDNGLITWAWRRLGPGPRIRADLAAQVIQQHVSRPRHHGPGRGDACGGRSRSNRMARPIDDPVLLDIAPGVASSTIARIIHVDVFGNATTNMDHEAVQSGRERSFSVEGPSCSADLQRTYWDAAPGEPLALIGSSGIAGNRGPRRLRRR